MTIMTLEFLKISISDFISKSSSDFEISPQGNLKKDIYKVGYWIKNQNIFADLWYELQHQVFKALKLDKELKLVDYISAYQEEDGQFPPDIVKCFRLYCCLSAIKPSHILEFGCGTSSMIINTYINRAMNSCTALSVDNDYSWINLTKSKIHKTDKSLEKEEQHHFLCHTSEEETK